MQYNSKTIYLILLFIFIGCSSGEQPITSPSSATSSTLTGGSIVFEIKWIGASTGPSKALGPRKAFRTRKAFGLQRALDCSATGVSTIEATVSSSGSNIATGGPWSCTDHSATISNITAGSNYTVVVQGKDSSGVPIYQGETTGITVTDGQTTDAGSIVVTEVSSNITEDATAPTNTTSSNFISSGAASTSTTSVTLAIAATDDTGVTGYYASETSTAPSASTSGWTSITSATSYSADVTFTLSSVDGSKTVYVWFRDFIGNVSSAASDTITLSTGDTGDTTAPTSTSSDFIDSGAASTSTTSVTLAIAATDDTGVTGYYASETSTAPSASDSGWTSVSSVASYSASVSFTLSSGDGTKTVYVWFKDAAGNVSSVVSDTINKVTTSTSSDGRYTDNGDGTITDSQTGLMWTQEDSYNDTGSCMNGGDASESYVAGLSTGGHSDWRMPTVSELQGIYESSKSNTDSGGNIIYLDPIFASGAARSCWIEEYDAWYAYTFDFLTGNSGLTYQYFCNGLGVRAVR